MRRWQPTFLAVLALSGSCARHSDAPGHYESSMAAPVMPASPEPMPKGALGGMGSGAGGMELKERGGNEDARRQVQSKPAPDGKPKQDEAPAKRMVHYDGWVRVRVTDPRKTLDEAAQLAIAAGGYVERQDNTMVMLRVPVAKVRDAFTDLQKLGDVLSRSLTAQDVTDSFTAAELRLKTLRASRDRLIALLATVKDEDERLQILNEIRRLTETIDSLDLQVRTLASLAAYSRLTLETVPREQRGSSRSDALAAFKWMDALSPFSRSVADNESKLKLQTPKEFVLLSDVDRWSAESADGAVIWTHERKNAPAGSSDFWASALAGRLGNDFSEVKREQVGDYAFVTFIDGGDTHYRYRVGVKSDGKKLEVIEIYYPTPDHEARYGGAVNAAITGGAS